MFGYIKKDVPVSNIRKNDRNIIDWCSYISHEETEKLERYHRVSCHPMTLSMSLLKNPNRDGEVESSRGNAWGQTDRLYRMEESACETY